MLASIFCEIIERQYSIRRAGFSRVSNCHRTRNGLAEYPVAPATPPAASTRARFVKGWFQNSVGPFLAEHDLRKANPLLVHFDADLYSSTLFLLATLWHHTDEYYFIFDEFMRDEVVAMYDFSRAFPIEYEFFAQTTTSPYTQVFGKMRRKELKPGP